MPRAHGDPGVTSGGPDLGRGQECDGEPRHNRGGDRVDGLPRKARDSEKQVARTERELQKVQFEEDRAIRLYVSEKITEEQLGHKSKFITEWLETLG